MKVFTYSEARQNLSKLLSMAQKEEIEIRRKDGSVFSLKSKRGKAKSPFDVPGVKTLQRQRMCWTLSESRASANSKNQPEKRVSAEM